jgi:hypothetical protein
VSLIGGAADGAYAALTSEGPISLTVTGDLLLQQGAGIDSDAAVLGRNGGVVVTAANCIGCATLTAWSLGDGATQQGIMNGGAVAPPPPPAPAPPPPAPAPAPVAAGQAPLIDPITGVVVLAEENRSLDDDNPRRREPDIVFEDSDTTCR